MVWDRNTGEPVYNAIVWQDTRTETICDELAADGGQDRFRAKVGLPLPPTSPARRSSGSWTTSTARARGPRRGDLLFGNIDSWVHLEPDRRHRRRRARDRRDQRQPHDADGPRRPWTGTTRCCDVIGIPQAMLPGDPVLEPRSTATADAASWPASRSPASSATSRPPCSARPASTPGEAKNTYGTGNFLLLNTGTEPVPSKNGLLTTVGYKLGDEPAVYALEGSIAVTGALVQWLRDNLGLIATRAGGRGARRDRRGQRRRVLRAGVLRAVRAVLAHRRARRDRRADPLRQQGPHRPRRAGGHGLPDPRGRSTR